MTSLSAGGRARAMLARVLAADVPLLLAGEPLAALDPVINSAYGSPVQRAEATAVATTDMLPFSLLKRPRRCGVGSFETPN